MTAVAGVAAGAGSTPDTQLGQQKPFRVWGSFRRRPGLLAAGYIARQLRELKRGSARKWKAQPASLKLQGPPEAWNKA